MSGTEETNVRVINEEYDRVLSNPDNLIMSEELQSLIDLNLNDQDEADQAPSIDPITLSIRPPHEGIVSTRGELSELSHDGHVYTLRILTGKVKKDTVKLLERYMARTAPLSVPISIRGIVHANAEIDLKSWSIKHEAPHAYSLEIKFRSDNVIF